MQRRPFLLALLFCGGTALSASGQTTDPTTTIIFVRHAEAAGGMAGDPSLSPAGEARAQALVKALTGSGVNAVYSSQFERTKQTGGVVAKAFNLPAVVVVPVDGAKLKEGAAALVAMILHEHRGETVLVVGHSNTVPVMVKQASSIAVDAIADTEFDRMFIVTLRGNSQHVIQARY